MQPAFASEGLVLVLDTCGERGSVALFRDSVLIAERILDDRAASAVLLAAVREMLATEGRTVQQLTAVGVVSGPGSFTGVRVGLAMSKGLCEAAGLPLAAVSRLRVLADVAGLRHGFALLPAGRGQVFVRQIGGEADGREWLASLGQIIELTRGSDVAVASTGMPEALVEASAISVVELSARHAIAAVRQCLQEGGSDLMLSDANYVRNEAAIYGKAVSDPAGRAG